VLPRVPMRHWICSLPWGLRALLGYDRVLAALVVSAFAHELDRSLCKRAKPILDLPSVADAHTGAIAAVQRTVSALRLNVHFHVLALDGVYVRTIPMTLSSFILFQRLPMPKSPTSPAARYNASRKSSEHTAAPSTRQCKTTSRPSCVRMSPVLPPAMPLRHAE